MNVKTQLAARGNYGSQRPVSAILYIVMHYTANDGDSAENNGKYFANNVVKSSAHYFVDSDSIVQSVPDDYTAWHCGASTYKHPACRNANAIGVELCDDCKNGRYDFTEAELQLAAALVRELMEKYKVPLENVIRHHDVTGKNCPAPFVEDPKAWAAFKARLIIKKEIKVEIKEEREEEDMVIYKTLADMPAWARPTVEKLLAKGCLQGQGDALNLEHHMLRGLVINDRAGLYGA